MYSCSLTKNWLMRLYETFISNGYKIFHLSSVIMPNDIVDLKGDGTLFTVERIVADSWNAVFCPNRSCGKVYDYTFFVAFSKDRTEVYCKSCNPNPRRPTSFNWTLVRLSICPFVYLSISHLHVEIISRIVSNIMNTNSRSLKMAVMGSGGVGKSDRKSVV